MSVAKIIGGHFEANCDANFRIATPTLHDIWEEIRATKRVKFSSIVTYYQHWKRRKLDGKCCCKGIYGRRCPAI